jgi:hypothetical protein
MDDYRVRLIIESIVPSVSERWRRLEGNDSLYVYLGSLASHLNDLGDQELTVISQKLFSTIEDLLVAADPQLLDAIKYGFFESYQNVRMNRIQKKGGDPSAIDWNNILTQLGPNSKRIWDELMKED